MRYTKCTILTSLFVAAPCAVAHGAERVSVLECRGRGHWAAVTTYQGGKVALRYGETGDRGEDLQDIVVIQLPHQIIYKTLDWEAYPSELIVDIPIGGEEGLAKLRHGRPAIVWTDLYCTLHAAD